jgi:endonuclease/exonuclease/phosphatase (EEP) superfamily protein YafD
VVPEQHPTNHSTLSSSHEVDERRILKKWLRRLRFVVEAVIVGSVVAIILARVHPLFDLVTHASFHLFVVSGSAAAYTLFELIRYRLLPIGRPKRILRASLLLTSFFVFLLVVQPWTLVNTAPENTLPNKGLRVLSWNILLMNNRSAEVIELLEEHDADIVILMEVNKPMGTLLEPLRERYACNFWNPAWSSGGAIVLSKVPNVEFKEIPLTSIGNQAIEVLVPESANSPSYRLLAVHTFSPVSINRAIWRDKQLRAIGEWLLRSEKASCAIGDYNTTPWSPGFRDLVAHPEINDTRVHRGLFATWPSLLGPLGVPIDHALTNAAAVAIDRGVDWRAPGSDHCPITVTLK